MSAYRSGTLAGTLHPLVQHQLAEFGRVAAAVSGPDLALKLSPFEVKWPVPKKDNDDEKTENSNSSCCQKIRAFFGKIVNSAWLERISIFIVLINCITLTFHRPCAERIECDWMCITWKTVDKVALLFFIFEMLAKIIYRGIFKYAKEPWHYLDVLIVIFGLLDEVFIHFQLNLASIRAMRILRPVRTIEWIPSVRLLVSLLFDTLPMLANVFLLSIFFFVIFGIMAVQLWAGILRQRCYHPFNLSEFPEGFPGVEEISRNEFFRQTIGDFLCTFDDGLHHCSNVPPSRNDFGQPCSLSVNEALTEWRREAGNIRQQELLVSKLLGNAVTTEMPTRTPKLSSCINWNRAYNECRTGDQKANPADGAVSFDNVLMAWVSIFQVITLEGWSEIMYNLQDSHSFWVFLYFVPLILFGSYFLVNLCLACITIQLARSQYLYHAKTSRKSSSKASSTVAEAIADHWTIVGLRSAIGKTVQILTQIVDRGASPRYAGSEDNFGETATSIPNTRFRSTTVENFLTETSKRCSVRYFHRSFSFSGLDPSELAKKAKRNSAYFFERTRSACSLDTAVAYAKNRDPSSLYLPSNFQTSEQLMSTSGNSLLDSDIFTDAESHITDQAIVTIHRVPTIITCPNTESRISVSMSELKKSERVPMATIGDEIESLKGLTNSKSTETDNGKFLMSIGAYWYKRWLRLVGRNRRTKKAWTKMENCANKLRNSLTQVMLHPVTDYFFMYCISVNTLCLAVEHHDQPRALSITVHATNLLFTLVFAIELICKVICFGISHYTRNAFNMIDAIVVFFAIADVFGSTTFSVFRAFRLVRLFKLMAFVPSLRGTLASLFRVVDSAITFLVFLVICMYVFALFGTFLLGGRLCKTEFSDSCVCGQPPPGATSCKCNRKNFDSFLTSMLSVFQIFTQESWNELLYESMTRVSPWLAVYFILLVMVGNFVLLNLLIAILVSGFLQREVIPRTGNGNQGQEPLQEKAASETSSQYFSATNLFLPNSNHVAFSPGDSSSSLTTLTVPCPSLASFEEFHHLEIGGRGPTGLLSLCRQMWHILVAQIREELESRWDYSFFCLPPENTTRRWIRQLVEQPMFEGAVFALIAANCVAVAIENPNIKPDSSLRVVLDLINDVMTILFTVEMILKMTAFGALFAPNAYLRSGWNILDCILAIVCMSEMIISKLLHGTNTQILSALRVLRMLRALRPLRVINSSRSLRLIVETVFSSMNEIGTVVLICLFFFFIYAIFGVQQFKGCLGRCRGSNNITNINTRVECLLSGNRWHNDFYNFDNVFVALQTLFVFATFDNWMAIMFSGVDCVAVDQQPQQNYNVWRMAYFVSFIIFCGFFLLNIFVGVVVSNFQRNFDAMKARDAAAAQQLAEIVAQRMLKNRLISVRQNRYKSHSRDFRNSLVSNMTKSYSTPRLRKGASFSGRSQRSMRSSGNWSSSRTQPNSFSVEQIIRASHKSSILGCCGEFNHCRDRFKYIVTHPYFDLISGIAILLNVVVMALEHYDMSKNLESFVIIASHVFTGIFTIEMIFRLASLGCRRYFTEGWNIFDGAIVLSSLASTVFEELSRHELALNTTLVRVMRIVKFARVLKVLRVANTMHRIIDTVGKSLLQVGHLSLLIVLVFFIYAALGVELFGRLNWHQMQLDRDCTPGQYKCHVLGEHANFANMGMGMLTLFRMLTGDNWSGLLKDIVTMPCDSSGACKTAPPLSYEPVNTTVLHELGIPIGSYGEPLYCCVPSLLPAVYFISFVLITTLCLLNLVVAVIMGSLEDSYEYEASEANKGVESGIGASMSTVTAAALISIPQV